MSRPEKQRERERRPKERTKENLEKPGKEREAWLCAHTRTLVRSLIIFPVAAEGKVAAAGCSQGEWKNIVISRRHTVFLLKQPPAILQAAAESASPSSSSPSRERRCQSYSWKGRRNVDQQAHRPLNREIPMLARS